MYLPETGMPAMDTGILPGGGPPAVKPPGSKPGPPGRAAIIYNIYLIEYLKL